MLVACGIENQTINEVPAESLSGYGCPTLLPLISMLCFQGKFPAIFYKSSVYKHYLSRLVCFLNDQTTHILCMKVYYFLFSYYY